MKTTTIFFLFIIVSNFLFGQTLTTEIKTPLGYTVPYTYYLGEHLDSITKAALSDSVRLNYPDATEVNPPSATTLYNCHSFAWYRSEGGDKNVWIGWGNSTAEDSYWLDGSYIEVSGIADGEKISYAGDHSAIVLSGANCRSKWGAWPLVDHPVGYGPYIYTMSQRTYYTTLYVEGPSMLCSSTNITYTTPGYVGCTYNWTYDTNRFNYVSGQGTSSFQVAPKDPLVSGQGWVKLNLTINSINLTREITRSVWVGDPNYTFHVSRPDGYPVTNDEYGDLTFCPHTNYEIYINWLESGCNTAGEIWDIPSEWTVNSNNGTVISINTNDSPDRTIGVEAVNMCCGTNFTLNQTFGNSTTCDLYPPNYLLTISPNPSAGETTLSIGSKTAQKMDALIEWDLEVYDSMQALKIKTQKIKGDKQILNTSGWRDGVYIVRAKVGDILLSEKLVVKH